MTITARTAAQMDIAMLTTATAIMRHPVKIMAAADIIDLLLSELYLSKQSRAAAVPGMLFDCMN